MAFQLTPSKTEETEFLNDISGFLKDKPQITVEDKTDSFYDKWSALRSSISVLENQLELLRSNHLYESSKQEIDLAKAYLSKAKETLI